VRRAKRRYTNFQNPATGAFSLLLPFSNRRHAQFTLHGQNGCTLTSYTLTGYTFSGTQVVIASAVALGGVTDYAFHFGGTDHEEVFEQLELAVVTSVAGDLVLQAHAIGDL
jgi:hypothetical protein